MKALEVAKIAGGMGLWGQPHLASSTPLCRCYSMYLCVMLGRERSGEDQCIITAPLESVEARCVCTVGPGNRKRVPGKGAMGRHLPPYLLVYVNPRHVHRIIALFGLAAIWLFPSCRDLAR